MWNLCIVEKSNFTIIAFLKNYKSHNGLKTTTIIIPISKTVGISLIIL